MRTIVRDFKFCSTCERNEHQKSSFRMGPFKFTTLACDHVIREDVLSVTPKAKLEAFQSKDGQTILPWQPAAVQKAEMANCRVIIGDQMGLGKMVDCCFLLAGHPELLPALVLCKARTRWQWFEHLVKWSWTGSRPGLLPQVIEDGKDRPHTEIFNVVVTSYDGLWRQPWVSKKVKKKWGDGEEYQLLTGVTYPFKSIILDEFQLIKNADAERTRAARLIGAQMTYVIGTSGTPVKNNAAEFFNILNMIAPQLFPSEQGFLDDWVEKMYKDNGGIRLGGIKTRRWEEFKALIEPFYIRRIREEVAPDLPKIFRTHEYYKLAGKAQQAYEKELATFSDAYAGYDGSSDSSAKFRGWSLVFESMMRMRRIIGTVKAMEVVEYVRDFLESTDRKITLFHHHIDAGNVLFTMLTNVCADLRIEGPIHLNAAVSEKKSVELVEQFKTDPKKRILIARQLAEGEGLNLQACGDVVMVERQWNPANEEQAESRFPRPGSPYDKINVMYPVAVGTLDEFMAELVAQKRVSCERTYGKGAPMEWSEDTLVKELAAMLAKEGMKRWKM